MKNAGTRNETLPRLYQDYVGHDNNRDAYMLNMIESRVVEHTAAVGAADHLRAAPVVALSDADLAAAVCEPIATHAPYLMSRQVNTIGMAIAQGLEERGGRRHAHGHRLRRLVCRYIDYAPMFKNISAFWTETALAGMASSRDYKIDTFPRDYRDLRPRALREPVDAGTLDPRNAVEYMETASLSVLDYAARFRENLLMNRYRSAGGRSKSIAVKDRMPTSCPRTSGTRPRPSSCSGAWRSVACVSRNSPGRTRGDVPGRHVGDSRRSGVHRAGPGGPRPAAVSRSP